MYSLYDAGMVRSGRYPLKCHPAPRSVGRPLCRARSAHGGARRNAAKVAARGPEKVSEEEGEGEHPMWAWNWVRWSRNTG